MPYDAEEIRAQEQRVVRALGGICAAVAVVAILAVVLIARALWAYLTVSSVG